MNPQHVANYAVLRFLPYPETGEFANIGVVAYCPEMRWCGWAGDDQDVQRVTQFFPGVTAAAYLRQKEEITAEIERVCALVENTTDRRLGNSIFNELVRHRESLFRFGDMRTILMNDPQELIQRLCDQYVRQKRPATTLAVA